MKPHIPAAAVLVLACGAQLMVVLDGLVVNVALPQMRLDLGMSPSALQWVVNGYLVTFGGLLLLAARAADLIGHRRIFLAGVAVFTLASLAGGLAQNPAMLIGSRLVQGIGAAALAPSSLSLLTATHIGEHRGRALSIWSATSSSAGALGLVLGGVITSALGWRWVLLINVPIGAVLFVLASATLAPEHARERRSLDLSGAVTVTLGVGALTYGISQTTQHGWASGRVIAPLIVAAAALGLFILAEQRSPQPLVPLSILRRRNIVVANTIIAGLGAIMTATMYFLSLYLQQVLGDSPLRTGLALVPMSIVLTVGAIASKTLLPKFGIRRLLAAGGTLMAAGLGWLSTIGTHSTYLLHIFGPTLIWAAGASIVIMPCVALATTGIGAEHAGLASGLVNTARGVSGAVGLAILGTLAATVTAHSGAADHLDRIVHGYRIAMLAAAILAGLVALLALPAGTADAAATPEDQTPSETPSEAADTGR
ncbi:DHA2 family efflux MFS transporter permease subunit [Rhodococcus sp. D2-41]|uniref:DHA2 family efflux MFS transporter permease subunit n=1 Tax=Speluncibacter jeojiensis TaxID=2710754 RepID=UPI0024102F5C|nr:DHA2 family efflux MFS transporter permease subunit [Rhodococcus sp. D2-41]MDG3009605.1 DHA2 family efflux MFS transporter permease subunit [Rhodococcus sp. D2-41]